MEEEKFILAYPNTYGVFKKDGKSLEYSIWRITAYLFSMKNPNDCMTPILNKEGKFLITEKQCLYIGDKTNCQRVKKEYDGGFPELLEED